MLVLVQYSEMAETIQILVTDFANMRVLLPHPLHLDFRTCTLGSFNDKVRFLGPCAFPVLPTALLHAHLILKIPFCPIDNVKLNIKHEKSNLSNKG